MPFVQVDQGFVIEADTTINNTGEDIIGETGENTVPPSITERAL